MPEITAITPQKRDPLRCNIELDGRFFCGLQRITALQYGLAVGKHITMEELSRIQYESEKETAVDRALTHLTVSMKTEQEIRDYLKKKGYLQDVCDHAVSFLKEHGFLDDGQYAKAYVESCGKRKGAKLLAYELRRKGIAEEEIASALEGLDSSEAATQALSRYMRGKTADKKTLQKAYSHLLSKGFDHDTIQEAMSALAETEDAD